MTHDEFNLWWKAIKAARLQFTNRRDLKAWSFFFNWDCEIHDAYDMEHGIERAKS